MQRPDKLRILMPGDGPASEFYYDGKTMIAYAPAENLAAVADAPPTIDAALKAAYDKAAIFYPFTDLLVADPYAALTDGRDARVLHRSVGGRRRGEDRHGGVGQQRRLPADLDRRRRQAAAADPGDVPPPTRCDCATRWSSSNWQLDPAVAPDAFASAEGAGGRAHGRSRRRRRRRRASKPLVKRPPAKAAPAKPAAKAN